MKKKFIWLIVSGLMVAALVLASCAPAVVEEKEAKAVTKEPEKKAEKVEEVVEEKTKYGGILNILHVDAPISFDQLDGWSIIALYMSFTHDTLLYGDWYGVDRSQFEYVPSIQWRMMDLMTGALAESWEKPDDVTIIFHLRKGVRWQNKPPLNGREFVADDVVYHFERILNDPRYVTHHYVRYMESITAPDKYTVIAKSKEPYVNFEEIGSAELSWITAPEIVEEYGDQRRWESAVGTGPWVIEDYALDASATWSRNPDYWAKDLDGNQLPFADGIRLFIILDKSTQIAALRTGKVDLLSAHGPIPWDQKASLEATNPELQWGKKAPGTRFNLYLRNITPPLDNRKVRYALSMAIDQQAILDNMLGGEGLIHWPAHPIHPSYTPWEQVPEDVRKIYEYNPTEAKKLLAEAGYPSGFNISAQYTAAGRWAIYGPAMEMVQSYWGDIGVDLDLKIIDTATMAAIKASKEYEYIFGAPTGQSEPVRFLLTSYYTGGAYNRSLISDPYVDEMTDKIASEMDSTERHKMLKEVFLYMTEQCFNFPLPAPVDWVAWQPWLKGYLGEPGLGYMGYGDFLARTWLDTDLRYEMTGRR